MADEKLPVVMAQPWYCTLCGVEGVHKHWSDNDARQVMSWIADRHQQERPHCPGFIRVKDSYKLEAAESEGDWAARQF